MNPVLAAIGFGAPGLAIAAGAAVAVPVLIHLLLRRRRLPVEWAAMDLLREAIRRVERRRRIERLLLLAVRCLLVLAAGLAIAAPFVGEGTSSLRTVRTLVAVVDDSAASQERLEDGTAFARSVAAARAAIEGLSDGDRVAVVTTSRASSSSREAASLDRAGALRRLSSLGPTELPCDLPGALAAAVAIASRPESQGHVREVLVASSFRAGSVGSMAPLPTVEQGIALRATRPAPTAGTNLRIASLEPDRVAGGSASPAIVVTVQRDRGDGAVRSVVRAEGPLLTAPVERAVELAAGERERTVTLPLSERAADGSSARVRAVLATLLPDAQPLDDARGLVLASEGRPRAVVVDRRSFDASGGIDRLSPGEWVARAMAPSDPAAIDVNFADPAAFDARIAASADAVVVAQPQQLNEQQWSAIASFVQRGGLAVVLPAAKERAQPWTRSFVGAFGVPWQCALEATELPEPVPLAEDQSSASMLAAVSGELQQLAPSVDAFRVLRVDPGTDRGAAQLSLRDGVPFLLAWKPQGARGTVCMFTVAMDLSWTTLPLKPMMVPLWQELVSEGRRRASSADQVTVGSVPLIDRAGVVELRAMGADGRALEGVRAVAIGAGGRAGAAVDRAGLYQLVDSSGATQGALSASVDAAAASVAAVEADRLKGWLSSAGAFRWDDEGEAAREGSGAGQVAAASAVSGDSLAPWLLLAALVLAVTESVLARRFSHAVRPRPAPASVGGRQ